MPNLASISVKHMNTKIKRKEVKEFMAEMERITLLNKQKPYSVSVEWETEKLYETLQKVEWR